jgi:predicted RNA-binding protein with PUA domain
MAATGASKEYALNECGEIIRTVFEYEKEFKFKYAITFSVFGQDNLKWVTDKAIQIMNRNSQEKEEEDAEILREKVIAAQDTSDLGFNDLDDLLAEMGGE